MIKDNLGRSNKYNFEVTPDGGSATVRSEHRSTRQGSSQPLPDMSATSTAEVVQMRAVNLDLLDLGAFICDRNGEVLTANETAKRFLAGLIGADRRVRFSKNRADVAFAALLATALDPARAGTITAIASELEAGIDVVLRAMKLRHDAGRGSQPDVLVLIDKESSDPAERLRRDFGLTTAEARIATALAEGLRLEDICARQGIARATVRSHLKSIFRKTETGGQVQLAVLVRKLWRFG